jgi:hypothetical protein
MGNATNTHSDYVIVTAFPPQKCLHKRASMLGYTYFPTLVLNFLIVMDVPNFFTVMYVPFSIFCVLFVCKLSDVNMIS